MNELQISYEGRRYSFAPGQTVRIGRSSDNDVIISDPNVSRQHAHLTWEPDGWVFEGDGRTGTFLRNRIVTRLVIHEPVQLSIASPNGPVVRIEPVRQAAPWPIQAAARVPDQPRHTLQGVTPLPAAVLAKGRAATPEPGSAWERAASSGPAPPPGRRIGQAPAGYKDETESAFQILVPIKSWLKDPGWGQGLRLLVIPYALLPLVFLALFVNSGNLTTPGWAYSLYVAPLWAIAFWFLIRPPRPFGKLELFIGAVIIITVMIWMSIITIKVNTPLDPKNLGDALAVGFNEETTKALPVLAIALLLLKLRSTKLDVRMWMFFGTIAGLTFGVREASEYTTSAIVIITEAPHYHSANVAVVGALQFAYRVFVDGFQHAIWAGVAAFFIGIAVNYPRRRVPLVVFGVAIAAVLHAANDWYVSNFPSSQWPWILLQAFSLSLFLGYAMSAASIERKVRRTPIFRGDSMLVDTFSMPK